MNKLLRTIGECYPHNLSPSIVTHTIDPSVKQKLSVEFQDSTYSDTEEAKKYLAICDTHIVATTKHVKMNIIISKKHAYQIPRLLLVRLLRRIECIFHICEKHGTRHTPPLTFWILPSHARRKFPCVHGLIGPKNINGGFTYPSLREIYIFRLEEFPKVVLHETIHNLPFDTSSAWGQDALTRLYALFEIDTNGCPYACDTSLNPNEAVVETWANVFQILFLSHEYHIGWKKLFDLEKEWAIGQACKMLIKQRKMGGIWKEYTHSYSYIVIKAMLLWNVDKFVALFPYSTPSLSNNIISIITDTIKNQKFQASVTNAYNDKTKTISSDSSLRMTLLGDM